MKRKSKKINKFFAWILFTIYIGTLFYFMFFSEHYGRTVMYLDYKYNLKPFREIRRFWVYRGQLGLESVVVNLFGNVLAFVPYGMVLPMLSEKKRNFFLVTLLTFEFSLVIETTQLITKAGCFDVDDLILNTLGGVLGYMLYKILIGCKKWWRKRNA